MAEFKLVINLANCRRHSVLIEQLSPLFQVRPGDTVHLDINPITYSGFVYPDYLMLIANVVEFVRSQEVEPSGTVHLSSDDAKSWYMSRMNFFNHLGLDFPEKFKRRKGKGRFLEITKVFSENDNQVANEIGEILKSKTDIDENILAALDYSIGEVLGNIHFHSGIEYGGWVVAQYYPKQKCIRLMISDTGQGIASSLQANAEYAEWDEARCIQECVVNGVTSGNGMGFGLYFTSSFIEENGGEMMIYSGEHWLDYHISPEQVREGNFWQGTIVYLKINTDVPVDPANLGDGKVDLLEAYNERYGDEDITDLW